MKYLSIDLETTGLSPSVNHILEMCAIYIDNPEQDASKAPFCRILNCQENYNTTPICAGMHKELFAQVDIFHKLAKDKPESFLYQGRTYLKLDNVYSGAVYCSENFHSTYSMDYVVCGLTTGICAAFRDWAKRINLDLGKSINIAGKNFMGFDWQFMQTAGFRATIKPRYRAIDPAILYYRKGDECLPDLATCMERANLPINQLHDSYNDALAVAQLVQEYFSESE